MTFQSLKENNHPQIWIQEMKIFGLPYVWCYYPHRSRDALSPICGIFFLLIAVNFHLSVLFCYLPWSNANLVQCRHSLLELGSR